MEYPPSPPPPPPQPRKDRERLYYCVKCVAKYLDKRVLLSCTEFGVQAPAPITFVVFYLTAEERWKCFPFWFLFRFSSFLFFWGISHSLSFSRDFQFPRPISSFSPHLLPLACSCLRILCFPPSLDSSQPPFHYSEHKKREKCNFLFRD